MKKITPFIAISLLSILFAGCNTTSSGNYSYVGKTHNNVLGIIEYDSSSYAPDKINSFTLGSGELGSNENPGGGKTSLLWGLVNLQNY